MPIPPSLFRGAGARSLVAYAWASLSATLFAFMYFFVHLASQNAPWTLVACVRAAIGALVAMAVGRMRGAAIWAKSTRQMWLRSIFGTLSLLCGFYALGSPDLALGDAASLNNLAPVMIAVLGPVLLGERSGRRMLVAIPLALAGVVCIVRPAFLFGHDVASAKMLLPASVAILGAFFTSLAMIMLRRVSDRETPEAIATHFSLTAAVVLFAISIPRLAMPGAREVGLMLAAGLVAGFGQLAMTRAYALERAARVAPFSYLNVVVSALLGALALSQWPDALTSLGMGLVIAAGVFVSAASLRDHRRAFRSLPISPGS